MAQPGCKPAGKGADKPSSKENFAKSMGVMIKKTLGIHLLVLLCQTGYSSNTG